MAKLRPTVGDTSWFVRDRLDLMGVPGGWDIKTPKQFMPRKWVEVAGQG